MEKKEVEKNVENNAGNKGDAGLSEVARMRGQNIIIKEDLDW